MKTPRAQRLRLALVVTALGGLAPLVACQWLTGIDSYEAAQTSGSSSDASGPLPDAVVIHEEGSVSFVDADTCPHALPPPVPAKDAASFEGSGTFTFAAWQISVFASSPSGTLGLDLDGVCTDFTGPTIDNGAPTCAGNSNYNADLTGGIDNEVSQALSVFDELIDGGFDTAANINTRVNNGQQTLLLKVTRWDGSANATGLTVAVFDSEALEANDCDGGTQPDASFEGHATPLEQGCDRWTVANESFNGAGAPLVQISDAYVSNDVLVAQFPHGISIPFGGIALDVSSATIIGNIVRDGPNNPTGFTTGSFLGGRVPPQSVFASLAGLAYPLPGGGGLCQGNFSFDTYVQGTVCRALDIAANSVDDLTGSPCDAVSFATSFQMNRAEIGTHVEPPDSGVTPACQGVPLANCDAWIANYVDGGRYNGADANGDTTNH